MPQATGHVKIWTFSKVSAVKPVLRGHSKIDKTKFLKPCGSLMQVGSIVERLEHSAILLTSIKR